MGCRFYLVEFIDTQLGSKLSVGTLTVNCLGAFGLGYILQTIQANPESVEFSSIAYCFLGLGLFGGLTTFSGIALQLYALLSRGDRYGAGVLSLVSVFSTIFAFVGGWQLL